jgi:Flp pilus assembly secretin CpaC
MTRTRFTALTLAATLLALPPRVPAQDAPRPEAARPDPRGEAAREPSKAEGPERRGPQGQTLRVQLVITRMQGDKKLAVLPYTLVVGTGGARTRMRMGVDTPVPVQMPSTPDSDKPRTSFQYKTVGTNIDCGAWVRDEGRYQLSIGVESSSALPGVPGSGEAPLFRRFDTNVDAWLRDGQSLQTIASTDPVTGEVVKIDVTLTVVK